MPAPMNTTADVSCCPVCGARQGNAAAACPILKDWAMEAKMLYLFEAVKRSAREVDPEVRRFWRDAIAHFLIQQKQSFVFTGEEIKLAYTRRGVLNALCLPRVLSESDARHETSTLASVIPPGSRSSAPATVLLQHTSRRLAETSVKVTRWAVQTLVVTPVQAVWSYAIGHDGEYDDDVEVEEENGEDEVAMKTPRVHVGLCHAAAKLVTAYFAQRIDVERIVSLTEEGDEEGRGEGQGADRAATPTTSSGGACSFQQVCRLAAAAAASSSSSSSSPSAAAAAGILQNASQQDCEVLANIMVQQGLAVREGNYIKILGGGGKGKTLTETDKKVLEFRLRVNKLERTLAQREGDMAQAKQRATALHRQGLSAQAAVELWRYKKLVPLVEKLRGAVVNLVSIHYSIEGVATDMEIFAGLQGGNEALKQQQAAARAGGLREVMDVEDALREAQELISETNEIGAALAGPVVMGGVGLGGGREGQEEDAELLRELEALEVGEKGEKQGMGKKDNKEGEGGMAVSCDLPDISHLPHAVVRETGTATSTPSSAVGAKKAVVD